MIDRFKQNSAIHLLILIVFWILAILIVNPVGEFPLNDDFVYARSAMELSGLGRLVMDTWVAVTLVIHILWGSLFISVFGFSFSVLRISTLVMSLAGVLVSYRILTENIKHRNIALLLALFIAFNPVYFNLSFTYMTDHTFYCMVVLSILFYLFSFVRGEKYYLYLATLFSVLATLTRQVGLFMPLSALLTVMIVERKLLSSKVVTYFLHFLFILAVLISYVYWLNVTGRKGEGFRNIGDVLEARNFIMIILQRVVDHSGRWLAETGLWFLPLAIFFTMHTWTLFRRYLLPAGMVTLVIGVAIVLQTSHFPGGNIFYVLGLGPKTLSDTYLLGQKESSDLIGILVVALKAFALAGGLLITWLMVANIFEVFHAIKKRPESMSRVKLFSFLLILTYQGVFLGSDTYFDRYAMLLFLPVLMLILPPGQELLKIRGNIYRITLAFLIALVLFSVAATRDYLSWNQARWDMATALMEKDVEAHRIDGGLEFVGWHGASFAQYGIWETDEFDYVLTFKPLEGYEIVGMRPYTRLVPYSEEYIYALKKQ